MLSIQLVSERARESLWHAYKPKLWTISTERQQWNRWQFERSMQHRPEASALFVTFNQLLSLLQAVEVQSQLHQGRSILRCILAAIPTMWTVPGLSVWIPTTVCFSTSLTWISNIIVTACGTTWLWVTDKFVWDFRPLFCYGWLVYRCR